MLGFQLGTYRIEAQVGEGGMGEVYRAFDTKLNRTVAIKVLSDDLADAAARRRFQREAQMASSLNHPHIVTVHDAGEFEGRQYLVTEYVDGGTLKSWARADKRSWRQIVELLVGVADGLAAAHQAGILHRDIKPANILVRGDGASVPIHVFIADFGIGQLTAEKLLRGGTHLGFTRTVSDLLTGSLSGSMLYLAPEVLEGSAATARSDIYSLGVVLWQL